MPTRARMIWSVFKRNFFAYFINPTGYVFITVFILLGAIAAFWQSSFFLNNLANLDQLNMFFPYLLLFFVPALTMNVWAEERKQGTDELLFTLPGRDLDIVLGKYLAVLGIYTVAVFFSLSHVIILAWLGEPDLGLMVATYLGYWLAGAALLAVGMVASLFTANATVAFILGAVFCGVFVFVENVQSIFGDRLSALIRGLGIIPHFRPFGDGVLALDSIFYFLALAAVMLYVNVVLIGRRHFGGGEGAAGHMTHLVVRTVALAGMGIALGLLFGRAHVYADTTAERLHTLKPQTIALIDEIPEDRPVFIQAFITPAVPEQFVQTRKNLVNLLHRFDEVGGDRVRLAIHETEPYSEIARTAAENFNILPRRAVAVAASQRSTVDVFLGIVFTSGPEEFVIPFFDRGLPVEYELARSIRVVSRSARKAVGIVATDAKVFGGFDFQTMSSSPDWSFIQELRKQYEVEQVAPDGPYPDDLDALVVIMPSTLTQPQLDTLRATIGTGMPTFLLDDPMPAFNPQLSPSLPKDAGRNPFTSQGQPPAPPKGDVTALLASLGLAWSTTDVVWSGVNPHPAIADVPPEVVFVGESTDNDAPFHERSVIASGLQEVVLLYPGYVDATAGPTDGSLTVTPLVRTGTISGDSPWDALIERSLFGLQLRRNLRRYESPGSYSLAVRVTGTPPGAPPAGVDTEPVPIDVIMVSDVDLVSETFFNLRRQGFEEFNFDNVTFALNCIDVLAGDESFVALRKHRPRHRTLTRVEQLNEGYAEQRRLETTRAEDNAEEQLEDAQTRLDRKVQLLRERSDLDEQTRAIMLRNLEDVENRRLSVIKANIEQEKERSIDIARTEMQTAVAGIQRNIKWWAALLPPIPSLILAVVLFAYRYNREKIGVSERQLVRAQS